MRTKDTISAVQETEKAILAAAEKEFLTKGFAGARTTSIAEAAGVTHAMFHYYFRTKANLFEHIVNEKIALLKEALFKPIENNTSSLEEAIKTIIERHLDFIAANPDLPRFLIGEVYSDSERAKVFLEQIRSTAPILLDALQGKIDYEAASGRCRKVDAGMLMLDIASLNIFSFVAAPIVSSALGYLTENMETFVAKRKDENFDTIMRKLKP